MRFFLVFLVQVDNFSVQHKLFSKFPSKIINNKAEFLELYSKRRFERKERKEEKHKKSQGTASRNHLLKNS